MNDDPTNTLQPLHTRTVGDRIRDVVKQFRQEHEIQIKATARILGAAAQIAQNHDQLIDEVVEMVEQDLDQQEKLQPAKIYTVEELQQQFKTLKDAKAHFGIKANSWAALTSKLNEPSGHPISPSPPSNDPIVQRLETIEREVQAIRGDVHQILTLLTLALEDPQ